MSWAFPFLIYHAFRFASNCSQHFIPLCQFFVHLKQLSDDFAFGYVKLMVAECNRSMVTELDKVITKACIQYKYFMLFWNYWKCLNWRLSPKLNRITPKIDYGRLLHDFRTCFSCSDYYQLFCNCYRYSYCNSLLPKR